LSMRLFLRVLRVRITQIIVLVVQEAAERFYEQARRMLRNTLDKTCL
jgi:hypothetical protein